MLGCSQLVLLFLEGQLLLLLLSPLLALQHQQQGKDQQNAIAIQLTIVSLALECLLRYEFIEGRGGLL